MARNIIVEGIYAACNQSCRFVEISGHSQCKSCAWSAKCSGEGQNVIMLKEYELPAIATCRSPVLIDLTVSSDDDCGLTIADSEAMFGAPIPSAKR